MLPTPNSPLRRGRPRALDDLKIHQILNLVVRGCSIEDAARHIGCAASTIRREARRNPEFNEELGKMLLDAELFALNAVRQAAHSHWRAGRWLLERMAAQRTREQNRRLLNPRQLHTFTSAVTAALESEINDRDDRQRVTERIKEVIRDTNHNLNATPPSKPRRHSRSRSAAADKPKSEIAPIQNPAHAMQQ